MPVVFEDNEVVPTTVFEITDPPPKPILKLFMEASPLTSNIREGVVVPIPRKPDDFNKLTWFVLKKKLPELLINNRSERVELPVKKEIELGTIPAETAPSTRKSIADGFWKADPSYPEDKIDIKKSPLATPVGAARVPRLFLPKKTDLLILVFEAIANI